MEVSNLLGVKNRAELRDWLAENHLSEKDCWVVMYVSRKPEWDAVQYVDIVEEALCFGWIDSTKKKLPDGRLVQRLSPRRKRSHWTVLNKERCQSLIKQGLMTESGLKALQDK